MPTPFPRIAVTCDPELDDALERTRDLVSAQSAAGQLRALALRGARAVVQEAGPETELLARLVDRHGIRPARSRLADLPRLPDAVDPADPTPASDALRWARGD